MSHDGSLNEKLRLAFRFADMSGDGFIDQKELREYLMLITSFDNAEEGEHLIDHAVEMTFQEASSDGRRITFEDFSRVLLLTDDFAQKFVLEPKKVKLKMKESSLEEAHDEGTNDENRRDEASKETEMEKETAVKPKHVKLKSLSKVALMSSKRGSAYTLSQ